MVLSDDLYLDTISLFLDFLTMMLLGKIVSGNYNRYSMFHSILKPVRRIVVVPRRTLIDIPDGKSDVQVKNTLKFPTSIGSERDHNLKYYKVLRINAPSDPSKGKDAVCSKLFNQLGLKYESFPESAIPYHNYASFQPKRVDDSILGPIIKVPLFKFDATKFKITQEELDNAPTEIPESRYGYVTDRTPICTSPEKLKGVNEDLYNIGLAAHVGRTRTVYKCKYFNMSYWPPFHYMAKTRKSRPAALIFIDTSSPLNLPYNRDHIPFDYKTNLRPFKLSVNRNMYRRLLRSTFLKWFLQDTDLVEYWDGLYRFNCIVYPTTETDKLEFNRDIQLALQRVKRLDLDQLRRASRDADRSIPWNEVAKVCHRFNLPQIKPETSRY